MKPHSLAHGGAPTLSSSPRSRWRGGAAAALVALAVPLAGAPAAHAVPTAAAKLNSAAKQSPNRQVVALAQFKAGLSERQARTIVRAHHGKITDRLPAIGGFAVKLSAKQARALKSAKGVVNVTLNTRVKNTGVVGGLVNTVTSGPAPRGLQPNFTKTVGADSAFTRGLTGKGIGV